MASKSSNKGKQTKKKINSASPKAPVNPSPHQGEISNDFLKDLYDAQIKRDEDTIKQLKEENERLKSEVQRLSDENKRIKSEQNEFKEGSTLKSDPSTNRENADEKMQSLRKQLDNMILHHDENEKYLTEAQDEIKTYKSKAEELERQVSVLQRYLIDGLFVRF
ncbi:uncharacterized protein LOC134238246 [Saccostrea cucullata]|uniref:uncharacterized protein LOC134238246 n=1 Tax=Saccostrea cuccullata TaxID=36930 RepID=UPI002ED1FC08